MPESPKILLLDDDDTLLQVYEGILGKLPSKPRIHTASSGARAITMLESDKFDLLISDLNMPKMDGLQVLSIVRRKFPQVRTVVLTSVPDEQFRSRAYAIGIDLYLQKPATAQEVKMFSDCIESLLNVSDSRGFRGIQSKSLIDIIQMECLSHSSAVMRIINGSREARIWFQDGDVIDASVGQLSGESAFHAILAWRTGTFEMLPADPTRVRVITNSCQGLLLESAQTVDERLSPEPTITESESGQSRLSPAFQPLARLRGVQFLAASSPDKKVETWGVEPDDKVPAWALELMDRFNALGETLGAGQLSHIEAFGTEIHLGLMVKNRHKLCLGIQRGLSRESFRETLKQASDQWPS